MAQPTLEQMFATAVRLHQAGRLAEAESLYREILGRHPNHAGILQLLGVIAGQAGRNDEAVVFLERAIALNPDSAEAHANLANALTGMGRFDDGIAACRRALSIKPNYPAAHFNLGNVLEVLGRFDEAIAAYREAIALDPAFRQAYFNLGNVLQSTGKVDEAIAAFRQAIKLKPDYAEVHHNLGVALKEQGQFDDAISAYRRAIAVRPNWAQAHSSLGSALHCNGQLDQAIDACRAAIALEPGFAQAEGNLGAAHQTRGELDQAIAAYRQAIAIDPSFVKAHSSLLYTLHLHTGHDAQTIAEEHRRWNFQHAEPLRKSATGHQNDRDPARRLRIGYVSPDFRDHPVGRFLLPLLARHDKGRFEIFAYAQASASDAVGTGLRSCTDQWREIGRLSDVQAADLIRRDQIDILVDLSMHSANNRLLVFAYKPAPIQLTWLAYCSTTGLETIDYRLSDPYLDPPGMDESIYSEKTIRLPESYWCYEPNTAAGDVGPLPALPRGHITFGCLNAFCKVNDRVLTSWIELLRSVPDSQLLLHAHEGTHRQPVRDRLQRAGIEPHRLRFVGSMPVEQYFDCYRRIDIALDTFPYGGGTTTCDALWMGVPVVSLAGKTAVGRGGLSILTNIGLSELAAQSEAEYGVKASDLANDLPRLSDLRQTLRRRMEQSPLMDAPRFARDMEAVYRRIWCDWCAKSLLTRDARS